MKNETKITDETAITSNGVLPAVFLAVDVKMTPLKAKGVQDIIDECTKDGYGGMFIATEICDYLGIERRYNRKEIIACLPNGR